MSIIKSLRNYLFLKIAQRNYKKPIDLSKLDKILIIKSGGIGDAICIYPLLREIKKNYPNMEIDIYAGLSNHFMYSPVPYVNNIYIKYKKRQWFKTCFEIIKMKKNKYDLVIDLTVIDFKRTLSTIFINPKFAIATEGQNKKYGFTRANLSFYNYTYLPLLNKHMIDNYLQMLHYININNINNKLNFYLPNKEHPSLNSFIQQFKNNILLGINTDGSSSSRTLKTEQIISLLNGLNNNNNIKIILFSMPNRRGYFEKIIKENNFLNVTLTYKTKNIFEAAEIISKLDLLISPDTSFIHIASGLNIPTIGLYWNTPSKKIMWGPRSEKSKIIVPKSVYDTNLDNISITKILENTFKLLSI